MLTAFSQAAAAAEEQRKKAERERQLLEAQRLEEQRLLDEQKAKVMQSEEGRGSSQTRPISSQLRA